MTQLKTIADPRNKRGQRHPLWLVQRHSQKLGLTISRELIVQEFQKMSTLKFKLDRALVLFVALLGSLCGYWGYRPLEQFGQKHHATICELLALDPSTTVLPSYSTFRRVFQTVDAQGWVDAFNAWALCHVPDVSGRLWSIDAIGRFVKTKSFRCHPSATGILHRL